MNDAMDEQASRVRRAYEAGRLRAALPWALPPALLAAVSCTECVRRSALFAMAGVLSCVLVFFAWRGGVFGAAARVGFVAGLAAWVTPIACPSPVACVAAGLMTGLAVGLAARTRASRRAEFVAVASLVAALAGALGCLLLGLAGIAAMGVALVLGAAPLAFVPVGRGA